MTEAADKLEKAISDVLDQGLRTKDIAAAGQNAVSTAEMGEAVIKQLQKIAG
jgi:3-isopropylmalate dehydrogenase